MKKLICIAFVILSLCGCSDADKPVLQKSDYTFKAKVTLSGKEYGFNGETSQKEKLFLTVTSPDTVKGSTVTVSGDNVNIQFMGISVDKKLSDYPNGAAFGVIYKTLFDQNGKQNGDTVKGKADGIDYSLKLSKGGLPELLTLPAMNIEIKFYDVYKKQ